MSPPVRPRSWGPHQVYKKTNLYSHQSNVLLEVAWELSWVCILFLSQFCLFLYLMFKLLVLVLIRSYVSWRIRTRFCPHPYGVLWCLSLTFFYINKKYYQLTNSFFVKRFWMGLTTHIPTVALTSFVLGFFISKLSFLFI